MPPALSAPAKVNLFLHVGSPREDGFHPLESLIAFADCGDSLSFKPGSNGFSIRVSGRFGDAAGENEHNLVLKAAKLLARTIPEVSGGEFSLTKNLPAGAGLGGGSSDAAAALRLLAQTLDIRVTDPRVIEAAKETGSDVRVCLEGKARIVSGVGDVLSPTISIPPLPAVLVWPGVPASTPAVYRAYDAAEKKSSTPFGIGVDDISQKYDSLLSFLAKQNNDLSEAAKSVAPAIAQAEAALHSFDEAIVVRMSGSGSAVFAIYETEAQAKRKAQGLRDLYPGWWVVATTLG